MVGYIYLVIDLTNWKKYVGQHHYHLEKLDSNYHGSGHIIRQIYKKRPHTLKEVYLKTCYTQEELDEWEQYYIKFYDTLYPNGYNLQEGGRGGVPSDETRRKMSNSKQGKHRSEETKKKISDGLKGKPAHNKGKPMSEEQKKKLSLAHKGKTMSDEQKKKLSKKVLQFTLDDEFVREWPSTIECGRNGFDQGFIAACCRGKHKSAYGFKWCYA